MKLTKVQRNAIFRAVAAGKLDPVECEMTHDGSRLAINHRPTQSRFVASLPLISLRGGYVLRVWVGGERLRTMVSAVDFCDVLSKLQSWVETLVESRDVPDLWEIQHGWEFVTEQQYKDSSNALFSSEEQDVISAQLSAIKDSIRNTYALTAEQESRIDAQFDDAAKAAKRLGRKDWILLFAGGVFSLILTDIITPVSLSTS